MEQKRSISLTILGGIFVFAGGSVTFIILLDVFYSVSRFGFKTVAITNLETFRGFLIFAVMPIIIYTTGIGILLLRSWARKIVVYIIPLVVLFLLSFDSRVTSWLFFTCLLIVYFRRPSIRKQFNSKGK
jgi:hypothetical protein